MCQWEDRCSTESTQIYLWFQIIIVIKKKLKTCWENINGWLDLEWQGQGRVPEEVTFKVKNGWRAFGAEGRTVWGAWGRRAHAELLQGLKRSPGGERQWGRVRGVAGRAGWFRVLCFAVTCKDCLWRAASHGVLQAGLLLGKIIMCSVSSVGQRITGGP